MALYPNATKRLISPGTNDPAIIAMGAILHVDAANSGSLYSYFNGPSGGIESHFFIRKDGVVEQYRDTAYEADANLHANSFTKNGKLYGYVSIETQGLAAGQWNAVQLAEIKKLLLWLSRTHNFPLKKCATPTDPGVGYHVMFGAPGPWTPVAKDCPGADRVKQFNNTLVPWMAQGTTTTEDELSAADVQSINNYTGEVSKYLSKHVDQVLAATREDIKTYTAACTTSVKDYVRQTDDEQDILNAVATVKADVASIAGSLTTLAGVVADLKTAVDALPKG